MWRRNRQGLLHCSIVEVSVGGGGEEMEFVWGEGL
jgi:hypothetical protein